jgi:hypothetical protein
MPDYEPSDVDPFIPPNDRDDNEPHPYIPDSEEDPIDIKMPAGEPELLDLDHNQKHKEEVEVQRKRMEKIFHGARKYHEKVKGGRYTYMPSGAKLEFSYGRIIIETETKTLRVPYGVKNISFYDQVASRPFGELKSQVFELVIPKIMDLELAQFADEYSKKFREDYPTGQLPVSTRFQLDNEGGIEKRFSLGNDIASSGKAPPGGRFYQKPMYVNDLEIIDAALTEIEVSMGLRKKTEIQLNQEEQEKH